MADLSALHSEVEEQGTVIDSAVTLLGNLSQQLREHADDPDEIRALADQMDQNTNRLANAVVANTAASSEEPAPVGGEPNSDEDGEVEPTEPTV